MTDRFIGSAMQEPFLVLHKTKAGYIQVDSSWERGGEAHDVARAKTRVRNSPHWVAEIVAEVRPGEPVTTVVRET